MVSSEPGGAAREIGGPEASALDGCSAHDGAPTRASEGGAPVARRRNDLDLDSTLHVIRDNLGRADAFITAAEELIERARDGREDDEGDDGLGRHRNHVAHLVESAKLAVRAALCGGDQIAAALDQHRDET